MTRLLALAAFFVATSAAAQTIAITNATVCSGRAVDGCKAGQTIVVRGDKIVSVGTAAPTGAQIIDADGKYVTPGLVDGYSRIGTLEVEAVDETRDSGAGSAEISAAFDVQYGLNPAASAVAITRMKGVSRAVVVPDKSDHLFDGYGAIVQLGDSAPMLEQARAFQSLDLGEDGAAHTGGSRADAMIAFINALEEARLYQLNRQRYILGGFREALNNHVDTAALIPVLNGEISLLVRAQRASDIRATLALKRKFPKLKLIIAGASEGWLVARDLAAANVPVIVYALDNLPRDFESTAATMANAARLHRAGVRVALGSFDDQQNSRLMQQYAANLTSLPGQDGLSDADALEMVTAAPAAIFGINAGVVAAGRQADLVIWDGMPLDIGSAPVRMFINGQNIVLQSRQSRLRDRYLPIAQRKPETMPVQYNK